MEPFCRLDGGVMRLLRACAGRVAVSAPAIAPAPEVEASPGGGETALALDTLRLESAEGTLDSPAGRADEPPLVGPQAAVPPLPLQTAAAARGVPVAASGPPYGQPGRASAF